MRAAAGDSENVFDQDCALWTFLQSITNSTEPATRSALERPGTRGPSRLLRKLNVTVHHPAPRARYRRLGAACNARSLVARSLLVS